MAYVITEVTERAPVADEFIQNEEEEPPLHVAKDVHLLLPNMYKERPEGLGLDYKDTTSRVEDIPDNILRKYKDNKPASVSGQDMITIVGALAKLCGGEGRNYSVPTANEKQPGKNRRLGLFYHFLRLESYYNALARRLFQLAFSDAAAEAAAAAAAARPAPADAILVAESIAKALAPITAAFTSATAKKATDDSDTVKGQQAMADDSWKKERATLFGADFPKSISLHLYICSFLVSIQRLYIAHGPTEDHKSVDKDLQLWFAGNEAELAPVSKEIEALVRPDLLSQASGTRAEYRAAVEDLRKNDFSSLATKMADPYSRTGRFAVTLLAHLAAIVAPILCAKNAATLDVKAAYLAALPTFETTLKHQLVNQRSYAAVGQQRENNLFDLLNQAEKEGGGAIAKPNAVPKASQLAFGAKNSAATAASQDYDDHSGGRSGAGKSSREKGNNSLATGGGGGRGAGKGSSASSGGPDKLTAARRDRKEEPTTVAELIKETESFGLSSSSNVATLRTARQYLMRTRHLRIPDGLWATFAKQLPKVPSPGSVPKF